MLYYKEYYLSYDGSNVIYDNSSYGPTFGSGHDSHIHNNRTSNNSSRNFPTSYGGTRYRGLTGGVSSFKSTSQKFIKLKLPKESKDIYYID